jgi:NAD+ kinase
MPAMADVKLSFFASKRPEAQQALPLLAAKYGNHPEEDADVIVALGGDGAMLDTLRKRFADNKPVYGMNRGTIGFLMNEYSADGLVERIDAAERASLTPLKMFAVDIHGQEHRALAINEVSLLRQTAQSARLRIAVDGRARMEELVCDGIMVATPAGSTAYNLSAHGPILPIGANLLALTPVSAFRPRRWRGALLRHDARVDIDIQAAGAWSLAGDVADGLAEATPLEHLFSGGDAAAAPDVYDIALTKSVLGRSASSGRSDATASDTTPADTTAGA